MKKEPKERECANENCNETFIQFKSTVKVCSLACSIEYAQQKNLKDKLKEARRAKKEFYDQNMTVQELIKKVQKVFNEFIRERDKGKDCISCRKPLGKRFDAGHYYNGHLHWAVRFDEDNVHGQCIYCNRDMHGNLIYYREGLIDRIGEERVERLDKIARNTQKFNRLELNSIQKEYKRKISDLRNPL